MTVILGTAVLVEGCSQKTIYSEMYSPGRNRFVATVERTTVTELPPETTTTTTTTVLPQASPLPPMGGDAAALPEPATPPVIPGMEAVPAAPMDAAPPAMEAAPPAMDAVPPPVDPAPPAMDAVPPAQ